MENLWTIYIVHHPNTVEEQLLAVGWPGELRVPDDLVRHIHRIRQVLEAHPRHPRRLVTYRAVGYCLRMPSIQSPFVS